MNLFISLPIMFLCMLFPACIFISIARSGFEWNKQPGLMFMVGVVGCVGLCIMFAIAALINILP